MLKDKFGLCEAFVDSTSSVPESCNEIAKTIAVLQLEDASIC